VNRLPTIVPVLPVLQQDSPLLQEQEVAEHQYAPQIRVALLLHLRHIPHPLVVKGHLLGAIAHQVVPRVVLEALQEVVLRVAVAQAAVVHHVVVVEEDSLKAI
jgi:hypothetical protein